MPYLKHSSEDPGTDHKAEPIAQYGQNHASAIEDKTVQNASRNGFVGPQRTGSIAENITNEINQLVLASRYELNSVSANTLTPALAITYSEAFSGGDWNEDHNPVDLLKKWETSIQQGGRFFVECRRNNTVVGGCEFGPVASFANKATLLPNVCSDSVYINDLWVAPEYQAQQIGRFILVNVEQMALMSGHSKISLWTHHTSRRLIKFYAVNGYRDVGDVDPQDDTIMRKVFYKSLVEPTTAGDHPHD